MTDQKRAPAGSPEGGQFAPGDAKRPDAGQVVDLWGEDKGSFEFPPRPESAEKLIEFWRTVEIPESAARAVSQKQLIVAHKMGDLAAWEAEQEYRNSARKVDEAEAKRIREEAYTKGYREVNQFPQGYVYPAIRAAMMYRDSKFLDNSERVKVLNLQLRFPRGNTTPSEVWHTFGFDRLEEEIVNSDYRSFAALEKMARDLEELRHSQQELADRIGYDDGYIG